jgi:predicted AlkP superfamily pyrophosphatase or phosphodiesterase
MEQTIMRTLIPYIVFISLLLSSFNGSAKSPVILISLDGFAQNYLTTYPTPNLHKLMHSGITASLLPVYPSKTFPNHISIITGVYPVKHGIIHNSFYLKLLDQTYTLGKGAEHSAWLTADPLWSIAEQQGLKTAVYFWPESTAKGQRNPPTFNKTYDKSTPNIDRITQILAWLKLPPAERPQLIVSYFSLVDTAGHHYGLGSKQLEKAVAEADNIIGILQQRLTDEINDPVDLIVVSDHGMVQLNKHSTITWQKAMPSFADVKVINGQTQLLIYSKNTDALATIKQKLSAIAADRFTIYQKGSFPQHWHWNSDNERLPDMLVEAKVPFIFKGEKESKTVATHGYDIKNIPALNAIFIASGPSFSAGKTLPAFENTNIAPLILSLLDINSSDYAFDGTKTLFTPYLTPQEK